MTFDYAFILSTLPAFLKAVGVTLQVGLIAIATSLLVALLNATILVFRTPYLQKLVGLLGAEAAQVAAVAEQQLHAGALVAAPLIGDVNQTHGLLTGIIHGIANN